MFFLKKKSNKIILIISIGLLFMIANYTFDNFIKIDKKLTSYFQKVMTLGHKSETLKLIINQKDIDEIYQLKEKALEKNYFSDAKKYFNGKKIVNRDTFNIKFRMKGNQYDHYNSDRFSLRIFTKDELKNQEAYSIQNPKVRWFLNEWIFHQILKINDLPHLKYQFKTVFINNKKIGTYAIEQYFSDPEIFKNWFGEPGPILGFKDNLFYTKKSVKEIDTMSKKEFKKYDKESYLNSEIKVFTKKNKQINPLLVSKAVSLLNNFQSKKIRASSTFNMMKMGKYYALVNLLGARHSLRWHNVRYYYNPKTNLFEPLGYDSNSGELIKLITKDNYLNSSLHKEIMNDSSFIIYYNSELEKLKKISYLDQFFESYKNEISKNLKTIHLSDPNYIFENSFYYKNQELIVDYLNSKNYLYK